MQMSRIWTLIFAAPLGGAVLGSTISGPPGRACGGGGVVKRSGTRPGASPPRMACADAATGNSLTTSPATNTERALTIDLTTPINAGDSIARYRRSQRDLTMNLPKVNRWRATATLRYLPMGRELCWLTWRQDGGMIGCPR